MSRNGLVDFVDESMKMIGIDKWLIAGMLRDMMSGFQPSVKST